MSKIQAKSLIQCTADSSRTRRGMGDPSMPCEFGNENADRF